MFWIALWSCTDSNGPDTGILESTETVDWSAWSPKDRGPFNVGHIQILHTYRPLSDQPERTIPIEIWYPQKMRRAQQRHILWDWMSQYLQIQNRRLQLTKRDHQFICPVTAIKDGGLILPF